MGVSLSQGRQRLAHQGGAGPDRRARRPRLGRPHHHRRRLRPRRPAILLGRRRARSLSDEHFVFFNNLKSPDGSVEHTGDNLTGEGEGDDEQIKVNLAGVPADVDKIVFPVSIYDAESRSQNFGQVRNAFIRIVNQADGTELARYDLSEDASTETAMVFGELYRNGAEWKFRAVGQGYASGLARHRPGLRRQRLAAPAALEPPSDGELGRAPGSPHLSRSQHSRHATHQDLPRPTR